MTQQQWNDYYKAIAAQRQAEAVPQHAAVQRFQATAGEQLALQQASAEQTAFWSDLRPAFPSDTGSSQYQKEWSRSSDLEHPESNGTALRFLALALISFLCVVMILVILVESGVWPVNAAAALSGEPKAKRRLNGKVKQGDPLVGLKRSDSDRLIVPKRELESSAKLRKGVDVSLSKLKIAPKLRRRQFQAEGPCSPVKFTYCTEAKRGFFYNTHKRDCQSTQQDDAMYYVCPMNKNRFPSQTTCEQACVKRDTPIHRCFEKPVFMGCARTDVKQSWWYQKDSECVEWDFRKGRCPLKQNPIARSHDKCRRNCLRKETNELSCIEPTDVWCSANDLKFPFFAFPTANGSTKLKCLPAYQEVLSGHSCLTGLNKFTSLSQCQHACVRKHG